MPKLELLRQDHAPALLAFEQQNRTYFAASVPDRGNDYFENFAVRHKTLLAEQATGDCLFHVLVEDDGEIVGRVNLVDVAHGAAELGYRIAEKATGQGLATNAVNEISELAATEYGLTTLRAATTKDNPASHTVLTRTGFHPTGDTTLEGRPALTYTKRLR
ncbi:MAG: GNAT family N-acetyltransferase [Micromonosporaceae bacterium]